MNKSINANKSADDVKQKSKKSHYYVTILKEYMEQDRSPVDITTKAHIGKFMVPKYLIKN